MRNGFLLFSCNDGGSGLSLGFLRRARPLYRRAVRCVSGSRCNVFNASTVQRRQFLGHFFSVPLAPLAASSCNFSYCLTRSLYCSTTLLYFSTVAFRSVASCFISSFCFLMSSFCRLMFSLALSMASL